MEIDGEYHTPNSSSLKNAEAIVSAFFIICNFLLVLETHRITLDILVFFW